MLEGLKKMVEDVAKQADQLFSKIKDKNTFKRVVYSAYLIARADGNFDASEKTALANLIAKDFPQFKLTDIIDVISEANKKIEFDENFGVLEILEEIGKASGDDSGLIIRTACYIGAADGDFDADERKVAKQICETLNLQPSIYGL